MRSRQVVFGVGLLVVGGLLLAGPALGFGSNGVDVAQQDETTQTNETDDQLGLEITAFAQSSAAEAERTVENRMWERTVNESDQPDTAVQNRVSDLDERLRTLQQRVAQLEADRENMTEASYTARASHLRSKIATLRSAANRTKRHGIEITALTRLETDAQNMTGPKLPAVARSMANPQVGPPEQAGPGGGKAVGPPEDRSTDGETAGPGNGQAGPPDRSNETDQSNGEEGGPPDRGNETDQSNGEGGGPPDRSDETTRPGDRPADPRKDENRTDRSGGGGDGPPDNAGQADGDEKQRGNDRSSGSETSERGGKEQRGNDRSSGSETSEQGGKEQRGNDGSGPPA